MTLLAISGIQHDDGSLSWQIICGLRLSPIKTPTHPPSAEKPGYREEQKAGQ